VAPKFLFGHKGDVNGNLFFLDNQMVCYPCGHNIVIYSMESKQQKFIPGIEGSEGITAMALSHNRKHLAVCEMAKSAVVSVYNISKMLEFFRDKKTNEKVVIDHANIKKKRMLCSSDYSAKSFISVDFSQQNEKMLVTLGDDGRIVVWQWDKQKCLAAEQIAITSPSQIMRHVSFSNVNQNVIIVTGKDVYKYYNLSDTNQLKCNHSTFSRKDDSQNPPISTNFVCHAWVDGGKFIVCTDIGQILLFESSGDFKNIQIKDSTNKPMFPIHSVLPFVVGSQDAHTGGKSQVKSGFVVAGDSGLMRVFMKSESADARMPYKRCDGDDM